MKAQKSEEVRKLLRKIETLNSKQYWLFLSSQAKRRIHKAFYFGVVTKFAILLIAFVF